MLTVSTNSRLCRCSPGLRTAVSSVQAQRPGRTGVFFVRCHVPLSGGRSTGDVGSLRLSGVPPHPACRPRRSTPNPPVASVLRCAEHSHMSIVMKPAVTVSHHTAARIRSAPAPFAFFLDLSNPISRFDGDSDFFPFMYQRILECAPGSFDIDSRHTIQVRPIGVAAAPNPVDSHTRAALRYNGVDGDTLVSRAQLIRPSTHDPGSSEIAE